MKPIEIRDLLDYRFLHSLAWSGRHALCIQTQMDEKSNQYHSNLMELDLSTMTVKPLTTDGRLSSFVFEDEQTVLFAACRKKEDEPEAGQKKTVIYRLALTGGEARKAWEVPFDVREMRPIPGTMLVVLKVLENLAESDPTFARAGLAEDEKDYVILHEVPFVANGAGFVDGERQALILWDWKHGQSQRLTPEGFDCAHFAVGGMHIYYSGNVWRDVCPKTAGCYDYDVVSGNTQVCVAPGRLRIGDLVADDHQLIFLATDMMPYGNGTSYDFYRYDLQTGQTVRTAGFEYSIGSCVNSDARYGGGTTILLNEDTVYFTATVGYQTELFSLKAGKIEKAVPFQGAVSGFAITPEGFLITAMEPGKLQEIYFTDRQGSVMRHSDISSVCLRDKAVQPCEYAGFINRSGVQIDGWLIRPVNYDPTRQYPAILDIHGGPRTAYGELFFHEMQVWASQGYFVFFCNHRGSDGYGDEFADLRLKYGTIDYDDIMDFTDHILKENPQIDPQRLGVTGGSYGGYMTNWIIGHTDRFAAAASQRSIVNWISDYGTSGISYDDDLHSGGKPWDGMEKMWDHSPLKFIGACTTPTLLIHSFEDYTCAVSQAMELFTALKMLGVETRACLFKGENHNLSRSGKPRHRFKRLSEITEWMNSHLKKAQ